MKNLAPFLIIFTFLVNLALAQDGAISAFRIKWKNSKPYLLKIARKMPAKHYDFKPAKRQMSFQEQLLHIRENMLWLSKSFISGKKYHEDSFNTDTLSKKETIRLLNFAFNKAAHSVLGLKKEDLSTKVEFFAGPKTKLQILNLIQDHITHHRGQLIVYLNLKGIKPPEYVGW